MSHIVHNENKISVGSVIELCLKNNVPFAAFILPESSEVQLYIQHTSHPRQIATQHIDAFQNGFIFCPFSESNATPAYIIEPDYSYAASDIFSQNIFSQLSATSFPFNHIGEDEAISTEKDDFLNQAVTLQADIAKGTIKKAVLSRIKVLARSSNFTASHFFRKLQHVNVHSFRYLVNIPEAGVWAGATPEPLLTIVNANATIHSIAGTKKLNGTAVQNIQWGNKEIKEQSIVTQHIESTLQHFDVHSYHINGPESMEAANLVHLKTTISFDYSMLHGVTGKFLAGLHPTPSVCGTPVDTARARIQLLEHHERQYYTGFLGTIHRDSESHLFVNLRCLKILNTTLKLFAGAGITDESDPIKEWDETEQKLQTLMTIIDN